MNLHATAPPRSVKRNLLACAASALLAASAFVLPPQAQAATFISIRVAPPPLPVYEQPEMPGPGYMWTPGYWAWDEDISDYYWVPGTWVVAPYSGALWTPGYWGWNQGVYVFHAGYWGPHVGYYGGINYGYGYIGVGYAGGYWRHGGFYYNRAYNRFRGGVDIHIHVYERRERGDDSVNRFSFNGPGGVDHRATVAELRYEHEHHMGPSAEQREHMDRARQDDSLRASVNHGKPALAASTHPGGFDHGHESDSMAADKGDHGHGNHDNGGHDNVGHDKGGQDNAGHDKGGHDKGGHDSGGAANATSAPSSGNGSAPSRHHGAGRQHGPDNGQPAMQGQGGIPPQHGQQHGSQHGGQNPSMPMMAPHPSAPKHGDSHPSGEQKHDHRH